MNQKGVPLVQNFLHFFGNPAFLLFLMNFLLGRRCLLALAFLQLVLGSFVLVVRLVGGDETGLLAVQMSFQKKPFIQHLFHVFSDKRYRSSYTSRQLLQLTVASAPDAFHILAEPFRQADLFGASPADSPEQNGQEK